MFNGSLERQKLVLCRRVESNPGCYCLGRLEEGTSINLEQSLKLGEELGGHLVTGHVDGVAELVELEKVGDSWKLEFKAPDALKDFIAEKGSITLNGVSLTVNEVFK